MDSIKESAKMGVGLDKILRIDEAAVEKHGSVPNSVHFRKKCYPDFRLIEIIFRRRGRPDNVRYFSHIL